MSIFGVMPDPLELNKPLFSRTSTLRLIDEIAHLDNLCIVAGSGVAIDRTGLSWEDLIEGLLLKVSVDGPHARRLTSTLGPRQAGSIAVQKFFVKYGAANWQRHLANELRPMLYENRDWMAGRLSVAIAELWLEYQSAGRPISIFTTNYDEHIELDIEDAVTLWDQQLGTADLVTLPSRGSRVTYLHGCVPENREVDQFPVISERDYFLASQATLGQLGAAFESGHALIVGSGMNDVPLLEALETSRPRAKASNFNRFAILPREDLSAGEDTPEALKMLSDYQLRLDHFRVTGVFVDHYSQMAQLLSEVRIASALTCGDYATSSERYGERLVNWWRNWYRSIHGGQTFEDVQDFHHRKLFEALKDFRENLSSPDEDLKLELWLRWQPDSDRRLRLWASSFSRFSRWQLTRDARVEANSRYASVRAFCTGRVVYEPNKDSSERWKTFLALPVEAGGEVNLVVGSLVVASMTPSEHSCLSEARRGEHAPALLDALTVARGLAGVSDESMAAG